MKFFRNAARSTFEFLAWSSESSCIRFAMSSNRRIGPAPASSASTSASWRRIDSTVRCRPRRGRCCSNASRYARTWREASRPFARASLWDWLIVKRPPPLTAVVFLVVDPFVALLVDERRTTAFAVFRALPFRAELLVVRFLVGGNYFPFLTCATQRREHHRTPESQV